MTLELQAKQRLVSTTGAPDFIDTSDPLLLPQDNPGAAMASVDEDSVEVLQQRLEQAEKTVDELKRALEAKLMTANLDPGNDAAREGLAPSTTLDENAHPSLPEGDFVLNASFFTKDEARAAFAAFKAEMEAKAGRSLTTDEVVALVMAREEQLLSGMEEPAAVNADFADEISDGDAFDMLVDGDPSSKTDEVQELTQNDGGVETADDEQGLLMDDVSIGPPSLN
jgi:hypothetical protein